MRIELKDCGVVLNEERHIYVDEDFNTLQGVTGILHKHLFPQMYAGVSEEVLKAAAERGTRVHKQCEDFDNGNREIVSDEVFNYAGICFEHDLHHEASEYIVTDGEHFASAIDKVYRVSDDEFILADIKTTATLNRDYVRWQLSIYADWFEKQNKGAKVVALCAIWLRGDKCKFEAVNRVESEDVAELLRCEIEGKEYTHKELALEGSALAIPTHVVEQFIMLKDEADKALAKFEEVKAMLFEQMTTHNVKSWDCEAFKATVVPESVSIGFDAKKFEQENPELFAQYKTKETKRKSSLKLTFRENGN